MPAISLTSTGQGPAARQASARLAIRTNGQGLSDLTAPACRWISENAFVSGLMTVFCPHTSASLVIQENTDPDVHDDLLDALEALAPRTARYRHNAEGPDDMPAHIKAALTASSLAIPVIGGRPALGIWQAIYLVELRDRAQDRQVLLHYIGN